jgi:hypothetical protein
MNNALERMILSMILMFLILFFVIFIKFNAPKVNSEKYKMFIALCFWIFIINLYYRIEAKIGRKIIIVQKKLNNRYKICTLIVPEWYDEEEMYHYLRDHDYSQQIAKELACMWAEGMQNSFTKGFEKGYHYATEEDIEAKLIVKK